VNATTIHPLVRAIIAELGVHADAIAATLREAGVEVARSTSDGVIADARARQSSLYVLGAARSPPATALLRDVRAAAPNAVIVCAIDDCAGDDLDERFVLLGADLVVHTPVRRVATIAVWRRVAAGIAARAAMETERRHFSAERAELSRQVLHDPLTGLPNRRFFASRLAEEHERSQRYGQPLALAAIDVDHFKRINDTYGHAGGDAVLRGFAGVLSRVVRKVDLVARVGGEEFVIIAPATGREGATILAERLRRTIESAPVLTNSESGTHHRIAVTASFGIAILDRCPDEILTTPEQFLEAADAALYRAKRRGRNRVEFADV
jgi:diguanylate cyclase (GGDEF)-like protein